MQQLKEIAEIAKLKMMSKKTIKRLVELWQSVSYSRYSRTKS